MHTITLARFARRLAVLGAAVTAAAVPISPLAAQWSTTYEQFYLQAPHNWTFRTNYQHADRLFNAFDYGHAILYETLWRFPDAPPSRLEVDRYNDLTQKVLIKPPRIPLEESAIEPKYAQLAPEAKVMFDWAHLLHRQLYDVLAAAYAAAGEFDRAVESAETAIEIFNSIPNASADVRTAIERHANAFREKRPWRE